jgi:hypothetical protein
MISPAWMFDYQFTMQRSDAATGRWHGPGSTRSTRFGIVGLVGPNPRCEVTAGWLTLFPTGGWAHSFPVRSFSDYIDPHKGDKQARLAELERSGEEFRTLMTQALDEAVRRMAPTAPKDDVERFRKEQDAAMARLQRLLGRTRDLASYALHVGDALAAALQDGDVLKYARDGNGDYHYGVQRGSDVVFSAGTVPWHDGGGAMAIWQHHDELPNPHADDLKKQYPHDRIAETIPVHRPYVNARIHDRHFLLLDGDEALLEPYYIFLARSNQDVPVLAFEFTPRAVHAAGRLDVLTREQIADAARALTRPQVRML